jgi:hypothetical protein
MHTDDGYELLANRDEKLTRAPASGPRSLESGGVRYVAPLDGDFGGTWVGVNEFGVSFCLMNGAAPARGRRSRGLLVRELLNSASITEAAAGVGVSDLSPYAPFAMVLLEPGAQTTVIEWDGRHVAVNNARSAPLVSSSYDQAGSERARRQEFATVLGASGGLHSEALHRFHESHAGEPSAYSPCMHRRDAETVSFSRVRVTGSGIDFYYTGAAPCRRARGETVKLSRRIQ